MRLCGCAAALCAGCDLNAGTYTCRGNTAVIFIDGEECGSASVSGNTLSAVLAEELELTATRVKTDRNPFAGTWKGTDEDGEEVNLIFGATVVVAYYSEDEEDVCGDDVGYYQFDGAAARWGIDGVYDRATISGAKMKGTFFEAVFTASKAETSGNPFIGTWQGRVDKMRFELVIGETVWALHFFT